MGWLIDLAKASIPDRGAASKGLEGAPDRPDALDESLERAQHEIRNPPSQGAAKTVKSPLPPLSPATEARRRKVLAMLARDGGQYAILVEDASTDPVVMALATPHGTCDLRIPKDRYDPYQVLEMVHGWNTEPPPLWWRVRIQEPGGRTIEVDTPSGYTFGEWQAYAARYHGPGPAVTPIAELLKPPQDRSISMKPWQPPASA